MRQYYGIELKQEVAANKSIEGELKRAKQAELNLTRILVLGVSVTAPINVQELVILVNQHSSSRWSLNMHNPGTLSALNN